MTHDPIERILDVAWRTAIAVKLAAFAVFVATLVAVTPAQAKDAGAEMGAPRTDAAPVDVTRCTGRNLVDIIAARDPQAMARIRERAAATPNGEGVLWRVERDGVTNHLFGTAHVTDARVTDLSDAVLALVDEASAVVLELGELADPQAMQAAALPAMPKMLYMDGTTIDAHLSESELATLRARTESPAQPWQVTRIMRPWVVMAALSVPRCETAKQGRGVPVLDQLLAQRAEAAGVPVVGLETVVEQATFMFDVPEPLMVQSLRDVLRMGTSMDDLFETTLALYATEETALLWALVREPALAELIGLSAGEEETRLRLEGYAAFQARLLDERNRNMAERMQPHLEKGGAFVAVGALHLPGEQGLVDLLRARGWTVTRVE